MKLARSLLFRLGMTYAGLFLASVTLLLAVFYWVTIWRPLEEVKKGIKTDVQDMLALYRTQGPRQLASALQLRAVNPTPPQHYHALIDRRGATVTANLPTWPERRADRWLQLEADIYQDGDEEDHEALVYDWALPDGHRLLVGRDIEDIDDIREALWQASAWGLPSLLLLVLVGSTLMSIAVTRRLDVIDRAARRVMEGSLGDRIPRGDTDDDLDRLAGTLNEMLARIEKSMLSVRRVSDSVAHELRTPMARMQTALVELRASGRTVSPQKLDRIIEEANLMIRMFDAVLRISRIESGRYSAEHAPVDLASVVSDVVEFYEPAVEQKSVSLSVEVERGLAVTGDRDLIFQALANLLDNAVKFTVRRAKIRQCHIVCLGYRAWNPSPNPRIRDRALLSRAGSIGDNRLWPRSCPGPGRGGSSWLDAPLHRRGPRPDGAMDVPLKTGVRRFFVDLQLTGQRVGLPSPIRAPSGFVVHRSTE